MTDEKQGDPLVRPAFSNGSVDAAINGKETVPFAAIRKDFEGEWFGSAKADYPRDAENDFVQSHELIPEALQNVVVTSMLFLSVDHRPEEVVQLMDGMNRSAGVIHALVDLARDHDFAFDTMDDYIAFNHETGILRSYALALEKELIATTRDWILHEYAEGEKAKRAESPIPIERLAYNEALLKTYSWQLEGTWVPDIVNDPLTRTAANHMRALTTQEGDMRMLVRDNLESALLDSALFEDIVHVNLVLPIDVVFSSARRWDVYDLSKLSDGVLLFLFKLAIEYNATKMQMTK